MSPKAESAGSYPTSAFAYPLPSHLIARHPAERRDESRLLVLRRDSGALEHHVFRELPDLVPAGDVIVINETRVLPARLLGRRARGGKAEVLLLRPVPAEGDLAWEALVRPGARLVPGRTVEVAHDLRIEIVRTLEEGLRVVRLITPLTAEQAIARYGRVPLPPYIDREAEPEDAERYQTVYARETGSVAAPTAGLHFTPELLRSLETRGVHLARLVLHVGIGTFRPVQTEDPTEHHMHAEWYVVPEDTARTINDVRAAGGHVWAVGTTVVRTLEAAAAEDGVLRARASWTSLFIRPGFAFRVVDHLITNFHLPRSTLLMLVTAFGGYDAVMRAYTEAIAREYRFYSYGDAMAII